MRNESRKARVAARSSWASRSRSSSSRADCSSGSTSTESKARCRSGTWPCCCSSSRPSALASAILSSDVSGASSTRAVIASWAGTSASIRSAVNTGVRIARPRTTPRWRAPIVQPACRTRGRRISIAWEVSRSTVRPSPRPTSAWGAIVQARSADGRIASPTSPPAIRKQPTATSSCGGGLRSRAIGPARSAASATTDTVSAATAGDLPQPSTRSRTIRNSAAVSAADSSARVRLGRIAGTVPVRGDLRRRVHDERGRHREHGERHLHDEDRLPRDRLREQAARDRTGRRADHAGGDPDRDAAAFAVLLHQELEAAQQRQRAAERLHAPGCDELVDRARGRAPRRGAGEDRDADGREDPRLRPREGQRRGHGHQPQHEVERDQHPRDLRDGRVQVPQDVRQRERHHRGVREHQRHGHRQQRTHDTAHAVILAARCRPTCARVGP